jgi:HK97 family phage major capsid protein
MKSSTTTRAPTAPRVDLSARDRARYSLARAMEAAVTRAGGSTPENCLELDVSRALQRSPEYEGTGEGLAVPFEFLASVTGATGPSGGYLTSPGIPEPYRVALSRSIAARLGVEFFTGLIGRNELPLPSGESTPELTWINDSSGVADAPELAQHHVTLTSLSPRVCGAYTDVSRAMRKGAPAVLDGVLAAEFRGAVSAAVDHALFNGGGAIVEPLGILNDPAVELVALGDNGAALTRSALVDMLHALGAASAFDGLHMITTNNVRTALMRTSESATDGMAWTWGPPLAGADGSVLQSVPAWVSAALPDDLTKGSGTDLSGAILGRWSDAVVAIWGSAFELLVDPGALVKSGGLRVVCLVDVDAGARRKGSFVRCVDIATV